LAKKIEILYGKGRETFNPGKSWWALDSERREAQNSSSKGKEKKSVGGESNRRKRCEDYYRALKEIC